MDVGRRVELELDSTPHRRIPGEISFIADQANFTPEKIETRFTIPRGGESRVIDLKGGKRKLRSVEYWYDTKGLFNGRADVTLMGIK